MNKIDVENIEDIFGLTSMQMSMLFNFLVNKDSYVYNEQNIFKVYGNLNTEILEKAFKDVVSSNEMLRAVFRWEKLRKPVQIILKKKTLDFVRLNLSSENKERKLKMLSLMARKKINLTNDLINIVICKIDENEYELIITNHHIIMDGWSTAILLKEVIDQYDILLNNDDTKLSINKCKFKEFVKFQNSIDKEEEKLFWQRYLKDFKVQDNSSIKPERSEEEYITKIVDDSLYKRTKEYVAKHNVTFASFLYAAWGIFLNKYYHNDDVILGITLSGREPSIRGIESTIGLFINTIPLRINFRDKYKIKDLIQTVNQEVIQLQQFQHTSFSEILQYSNLPYGSALYNSVFVIQNYPVDSELINNKKNINIDLIKRNYQVGLPLVISVRVFDHMEIDINFILSQFNKEQIIKIMEMYVNILENLLVKND